MEEEKLERNREFFETYIKTIAEIGGKNIHNMSIDTIVNTALTKGASRFYISIRQANNYIRAKKRNKTLKLSKERQKMVEDLYKVYLEKKERMSGYYDYAVVEAAVYSPAPSFYISKRVAMSIIYK